MSIPVLERRCAARNRNPSRADPATCHSCVETERGARSAAAERGIEGKYVDDGAMVRPHVHVQVQTLRSVLVVFVRSRCRVLPWPITGCLEGRRGTERAALSGVLGC